MSHENFEQLQILFQSHIKSCEKKLGRVLKESKASGFVFDSGVPYYYFSDDQHAPFRSNPYFKYFCPLNGESHLLCFDENKGFELFVYEPASFWSDISYGAEEDLSLIHI